MWAAALVVALALFGPLVALLAYGFTGSAWSTLDPGLVGAAVRVSLPTSLLATLICCVAGIPLAYLLARGRGTHVVALRIITLLPLVMPPVVAGVALLKFWGRQGALGDLLTTVGISLAFTPAAVVLAQVFVSLPFMVITAEAAFRSLDHRVEWIAAALGASPWRRFRDISLPLAARGLTAGGLLCFARALGEFGATMMFAGSVEGVTRTLPVQIALSVNSAQPDSAVGLALILLALCAALVGVLNILQGGAIRGVRRRESLI
ncbi:molybdate ABC transporter permease subunit [Micrococcales bacterium 31B]|nr:molybdate ABC transporter permease subunit [Micrococcales bacterium 31B]